MFLIFMENTMITCSTTNPSNWNASPSLKPELLPYFVEQVAEKGGSYLTVNGDSIDINEAVRLKAFADKEVLNARMYFAMSNIPGKSSEAIAEMRHAAFRAGTYYRRYVRYLNLTENPLGTPLLLSSYQELDEQFKRGFSFDPFAERDYN